MNRIMGKLEASLTAGLWAAAALLLPMTALTPVEGGRAEARAYAAAASCTSGAVDILRICPMTSL